MAGDHVIITGGSSGIGQAMAIKLACQGKNISIVARGKTCLSQAQREIEKASDQGKGQVLALCADLTQQEEAEQAIQSAIAHFGTPELLVTSAGVAHPGHFQELPTQVFKQTMAINYFGTLYCVRAAIPAMVKQGKGQIVLISSGAGLIGIYGYSAYSPSKFALRGLAESLRVELKSQGIKVSIAYPPDTDTPQLKAENDLKPAITKKLTGTAQIWQPDQVASQIIQGLNRNQFEIPIGQEVQILQNLPRLIKYLVNRYCDRLIASEKKEEDS